MITRASGCPPGGLVDAADLKSAVHRACRFESGGGHPCLPISRCGPSVSALLEGLMYLHALKHKSGVWISVEHRPCWRALQEQGHDQAARPNSTEFKRHLLVKCVTGRALHTPIKWHAISRI